MTNRESLLIELDLDVARRGLAHFFGVFGENMCLSPFRDGSWIGSQQPRRSHHLGYARYGDRVVSVGVGEDGRLIVEAVEARSVCQTYL